MRWAARRRAFYITGVALFFAVSIGVPLYFWLDEVPTCKDGVQNQNETAVDRGGPCPLLDERALIPHAVEWSRAFPVRSGAYSAVAYIENPNEQGGVLEASYRFRLYDENNVIVAERSGAAFIMPGQVTPVFEGDIPTGNRRVSRTYFEFTGPLVWERLKDTSGDVRILNQRVTETDSAPRLSAVAENISVRDLRELAFVAVVFDPAGNALAASRTILARLPGGERNDLVFTWPEPFERAVGRVDIIPLLEPAVP